MTAMRGPGPFRVLLVEDDDWDAKLALDAFQAGPYPVAVELASDGAAALQRLRQPPTVAAPMPDIVILDLNLPKKNGHEVLAEMKADAKLRRIPVMILTTSVAPTDMSRAYDQNANSYLNKPFHPDDYPKLIRAIEDFWYAWNKTTLVAG